MSTRYTPAPFPQRFDESLLPWLYKELSRIGDLVAGDRYQFPPLGAPPSRYDTGTTVYANGTDWDPGNGAGLYVWSGSEWVLNSSGPAGPGGTGDHTLLINRETADQHPTSAITGLDTALAGKAALSHTHTIGNVAGLQTALDAKVTGPTGSVTADRIAVFDGTTGELLKDGGSTIADLGGGGVTVHDDLTGRSAADQHPISAITGLNTALDTKVQGPASATADALPVFDGTTGKLVKNSGVTLAFFQNILDSKIGGPSSAVNNRIAVFNGTTGKLIKDGGVTIAELEVGVRIAWADTTAVNVGALSSATWLPISSTGDPTSLVDFAGGDFEVLSAGTYLVHVHFDVAVTASTSTPLRVIRAGIRVASTGSMLVSNSSTIPSNATKASVSLLRYLTLSLGVPLQLYVEDVAGTFTDPTVVNGYISLTKMS